MLIGEKRRKKREGKKTDFLIWNLSLAQLSLAESSLLPSSLKYLESTERLGKPCIECQRPHHSLSQASDRIH